MVNLGFYKQEKKNPKINIIYRFQNNQILTLVYLEVEHNFARFWDPIFLIEGDDDRFGFKVGLFNLLTAYEVV